MSDPSSPFAIFNATLDDEWADAHKSEQLPPEFRLMLRILEDGIITALTPAHRSCQSSRAWIERTTDHGIFSFNEICEVMGIVPGSLRGKIMKRPAYRLAPAWVRKYKAKKAA